MWCVFFVNLVLSAYLFQWSSPLKQDLIFGSLFSLLRQIYAALLCVFSKKKCIMIWFNLIFYPFHLTYACVIWSINNTSPSQENAYIHMHLIVIKQIDQLYLHWGPIGGYYYGTTNASHAKYGMLFSIPTGRMFLISAFQADSYWYKDCYTKVLYPPCLPKLYLYCFIVGTIMISILIFWTVWMISLTSTVQILRIWGNHSSSLLSIWMYVN